MGSHTALWDHTSSPLLTSHLSIGEEDDDREGDPVPAATATATGQSAAGGQKPAFGTHPEHKGGVSRIVGNLASSASTPIDYNPNYKVCLLASEVGHPD